MWEGRQAVRHFERFRQEQHDLVHQGLLQLGHRVQRIQVGEDKEPPIKWQGEAVFALGMDPAFVGRNRRLD